MLTNREVGDRFDAQVLERLAPLLPGLKATIGSGSVFGDQDQVSDDWRISIKFRQDKGLSRTDCAEPYGREPAGKTRIPLTVLRRFNSRTLESQDYALLSLQLVDRVGAAGLEQALQACRFAPHRTLDPWAAGLTKGLLDQVQTGQLLLLGNLPPGQASLLLGFYDFLELLNALKELLGYGLPT